MKHAYIIITERCLKQTHPCAEVSTVGCLFDVLMALVEEEISLRKAKQHDDINDGEGKHVTSNHGINHCNERSGQSDGACGN